MPSPRITYKQWVRLYDLADKLYTLAPWDWLDEDDLIGIVHPETGEIGYISIMGASGEYRCLALYLGQEALHRFNLIHHSQDGSGIDLDVTDSTNLILETRQLHAAFETRDMLEKAELDQIKRLKRRYRGDNWPQFQSYRPGHCPGPINPEEFQWLLLALEQTLACAVDFDDGRYKDLCMVAGKRTMPCRKFTEGSWHQKIVPYDNGLFVFPTPEPSELMVAKVAGHKRAVEVECRCCMLHNQIGKKFGDRQYPYLLLVVDAGSGFVLGVEIMSVKNKEHDELIASVPDHFLRIFDKNEICPAVLHVADHTTRMLLHEVAIGLECDIEFHEYLPALEDAMASMPI